MVFVPKVSRWRENGQWQLVRKFCALAVVVMIFVGALAMLAGKLLGPWVCSLIFGVEILENIDLLVPLLATSSVLMIKSFFSVMMVPLGKRWILLVGECAGMLLCAVLSLPLTRYMGMQGANLSYLLGTLLQVIILCASVMRVAMRNK